VSRSGTKAFWAQLLVLAVLAALAVLAGCAGTAMGPRPAAEAPAPLAARLPAREADLNESPAPAGAWREHRLSRCRDDVGIPAAVEKLVALSSEFYRERAGSDAIVELELACSGGQRHPLVLVTLGQLYMLAGQGEPTLLPKEGPARDVGSWARNQPRLLARSRQLLSEAAAAWPQDAGIDYLLADVARASGDTLTAASLVADAAAKCTGGRTFRLLQFYQQLNRYPARHEGGPAPDYPAGALERREQGEVVVDLLLSPDALVRQAVVVSSPSEDLSEAATECLRRGRFSASRLGKYPIWSWLRVTVAFRLES
jgi:TonB family protein